MPEELTSQAVIARIEGWAGMVTLSRCAEILGISYDAVCQRLARHRSEVPVVHLGPRHVLVRPDDVRRAGGPEKETSK